VINDVADASLISTDTTNTQLDLLVGSGVAFRTWLYFGVDSIPAEATIARADLKFKPEIRYHWGDTVSIGASRLKESYFEKGANVRYESLPSSVATYVIPADSDSVVTIDIRSLVQLWVNYPDSIWTNHPDSSISDTLRNHGLVLGSSPEWSPLFRLRIPRTGPNAPRLYIEYVLPPEDRFH
jgi:hypothetical protein